MYKVTNTKTGAVILTLSAWKWERDEMYQNRIKGHLKSAGIEFSVGKA